MELFIVVIVGVIVSALLLREFGSKRHNVSAFRSHDATSVHSARNLPQNWMSNPAYYWMLGNIYHEDYLAGSISSQNNEDWLTDPCYSYLSGNIFHRDEPPSSCTCTGSDWMTDPCCSYMPGNIYHDDDHFSSSNSTFSSDDAWSSTSSTSCFDDSWSGSSSSFDDD